MDRAEHELEAVEAVCRRLSARFPDVPPETITRTVHEIHLGLSGPIRDYVPVLVEHMARDHLSAARRQPA
jgi:hypothetical protein